MSGETRESAPRRARRVGLLSRLGSGLQVSITVVLAVAAVVLINFLVGRPGIRQRFDLTATNQNTLSTASLGALERLEKDVLIEFIDRPEQGDFEPLRQEVMARTIDLVLLFEQASGGRIEAKAVDTRDVDGWKQRSAQLRIRGIESGLIVSSGERVEFLSLVRDLATFQGGMQPSGQYLPPSYSAFTAEEAIVEALLDVTTSGKPKVLFTRGAGELDIDDESTDFGAGLVAAWMREDGFEVDSWNHADDGELPEECDLLVVAGPKRPWTAEMYGDVVDHVERGGRILIAAAVEPAELRASDVPDLLGHLGFSISEGRVARLAVDQRTGRLLNGIPECERHVIPAKAPYLSSHPIVRPFMASGVPLQFRLTHEIEIEGQPQGGLSQALVTAVGGQYAWLDSPPVDRVNDPRVDTQKPGGKGYPIVVTSQRPPMQELPRPSGLDQIPEIRVVAFGTESVLWNDAVSDPRALEAGLLGPALNWITEREHRITVPPRDPDLRFLPRDNPAAFPRVARFAQFWLPGAVLVLGVVVWLVRSRGARRTAPQPPGPAPAAPATKP